MSPCEGEVKHSQRGIVQVFHGERRKNLEVRMEQREEKSVKRGERSEKREEREIL
jgi:hypothetical protein